jgi:hypothetical protein
VAVRLLVDPGADGGEHVAVNFEVLITQSWVMEDAEDIGHDFFDGNTWVLPCKEDSST